MPPEPPPNSHRVIDVLQDTCHINKRLCDHSTGFVKGITRLGGDGETGRNTQSNGRHFGQIGSFTAQLRSRVSVVYQTGTWTDELLHRGVAFGDALAKSVDPFDGRRCRRLARRRDVHDWKLRATTTLYHGTMFASLPFVCLCREETPGRSWDTRYANHTRRKKWRQCKRRHCGENANKRERCCWSKSSFWLYNATDRSNTSRHYRDGDYARRLRSRGARHGPQGIDHC